VVEDTDYSVRRLNVSIPDVGGFQVAYEQAVPDLPIDEVSKLLAAGAPWSQMVELIDKRPQPSTQFSSFGRPEIDEVGRELDRKLAKLLDGLRLDVPAALRNSETVVATM
jgi:hypothetical protein